MGDAGKHSLDALAEPIVELLQKTKNEQIRCRYLMILSKYGWNDQHRMFTKTLTSNDMMKFADELRAIHLSEKDMMESASKLLWSSKAEKTMVVTHRGRDVLKRHRMQKKANANNNNKALPPAPP